MAEKETSENKEVKPLPKIDGEVFDKKAIEQENRKFKYQKICVVCKDHDRSRIFLPCGHLCVCKDCKDSVTCCPICRSQIKGVVAVYR